jgi:tetratricopeptide (TPR) repeat protein
MVEIPGSLVERLRTRQSVLITGLGCSELVGAPGWIALVEWLAGRLVFSDARETSARLVAAGRLSDATALIRDLLPHPVLEEAMREAFPDGGPIPDVIRQVAAFPWRAVVTTAFGDLWQRALSATDVGAREPEVLVGTDDLGQARGAGAGTPLLHLFGRTAEPESLCLGPADARLRLAAAGGLAWLEDLARRRSFVFVGFRASDPDLAWIASWMSSRAAGGGPHYLFLDVAAEPDPDTEASLLALRTGLEVIPCLGGTADALDRLARAAREIGPSLPPSDVEVDLDAWLGRWEQNPADATAREVLARAESALREDERWDRLIELLLRRLELQDEPGEQVAALREVARIFREVLAAPDRALTAGLAALRIEPEDDDVWRNLRADARATGDWQRLVNDAAEVARAAGTTPGAARIWREIAAVAGDQLGQPDEALAACREALAAEPAHAATRDAEAELLRGLERWGELVASLRAGAAESHDPARAAALMLEAADVLEGRFGDRAGAIEAHEAALVMAPESEATALALERLYEGERRWGDLAALLDRRAGRLPSARARELRRRRVEILVEHLDALDVAARELEALHEEEPADRAVFERLEAIYRRADRRDDYLRILRRQADLTPQPAERLAILRRLAAEAEGDPDARERAAEAFERILELEPRDPEAFPSLSRLLTELGRPAALIAAQARRLEVTESAETKRDLLFAQAEIYRRDLDDPEKALHAYLEVEKALPEDDPRHEEIHEHVAELGERLERWELCAGALAKWEKAVATSSAPRSPEEAAALRAALLVQAGLLLQERLGQLAPAEEKLAAALAIDPTNVRALTALGRVRRDAGAFDKAAEAFIEAASREETPAGKAELFTEAAALLQDELAQKDRAVDLYTRALAADPGHVSASERLCDIYTARKQWAEVEALLDIQARQVAAGAEPAAEAPSAREAPPPGEAPAGESPPAGAAPAEAPPAEAPPAEAPPAEAPQAKNDRARLLSIQTRLAAASLELGKKDKALDCLAAAFAIEPASLAVLKPYAELRFERGEWAAAREMYTTLLAQHRAALSPEEALAAVMALGRAESELGNVDEAIRRYGEAKALAPRHRPAIEALSALHAGRKDWRDWVSERQDLVMLAGIGEKAALCEEIGDACADRLGDPARAEEAYRAALEAEPGRRAALGKLLDLYTKDKRWPQAAETLAELARIETEPAERAKTLFKAAVVTRDGLEAASRAAALFERCLDDAPGTTEAFEAIKALHEAASDWKSLAASYRRMLERLPADAPAAEKHKLWSGLGDLALERLRDRKLAVTAYEAATALEPADVTHQALLARLYETAGPDAREQAIAAHQRLLAADPDRLDSYLALAKLYGDIGEVDKQWCVAAALCFLNRADPTTEAVFKRFRPPGVRTPKHAFNEEVWRRLRHPNEDALLDELFALTSPYLSGPAAKPPQSFGLRRRQRIDVATDASAPSKALNQIALTMGLTRPDLFAMEGDSGQTALLNVQEKGHLRPTLLLGPATMRRASFDLVFELATHMAFLRPERFLKVALGTPAALDFGLRVTLALAGSTHPAPSGANGESGKLTEHLRKAVPGPVAAQLVEAGRKLMARGAAIDVGKWAAAADLSAARSALLLSGDLGAAARVISSEPIPTSPVPVRKRLADLVAFSASEDYFACRRHLGLHVA